MNFCSQRIYRLANREKFQRAHWGVGMSSEIIANLFPVGNVSGRKGVFGRRKIWPGWMFCKMFE